MTIQLKSNGYTLTCIGTTDASDGHDRYWLVKDDEGQPIDQLRLGDAFTELFYQPSSGAGSQYCTYCHDFKDEVYDDRCILVCEWRYDV